MALNFAETFLQQSGAAQDRSRSMAEMQLKARQFERQMAEQAKQTAIAKMRAETAEDVAQAQIEAMAKETELSQNADKRAAELFELQSKAERLNLSNQEFKQKLLEGEFKDQNAVLSDEDAALYGVPKGTKVKDVGRIQQNIKASIENTIANKQLTLMNTQEAAMEDVRFALEDVINPEVTAQNVSEYMPIEQELTPYETFKRKTDMFVNRLYAGLAGQDAAALGEGALVAAGTGLMNAILPDRLGVDIEYQKNIPSVREQAALGRYELGEGFSAETIRENLNRYEGQRASEMLSPQDQKMREAAINYFSVFGNQGQNIFQLLNMYGNKNPGVVGFDPTQFIPQAPVEGQDE